MKSSEQSTDQENIIAKSIESADKNALHDKENKIEEAEGEELFTIAEQRMLFKQFLKEKIYGREMSERQSELDLAEQIQRLVENGIIENLSLDLKTGRIHFKYKPKSRSILGFFADYMMNTDKRIAEDRKRLLQGTTIAKFGTGITSKLDAPFGGEARKAADEFESLREAGINVEKDGDDVSLSFDQESEEGKVAVGAFSKMLTKEQKPESNLEIGNFVQWNSSGANQWESARKIEKFSDDGKFAFFEGSATGIPVGQLSVENQPTKKEEPLGDKEKIEKVRENLGMQENDFFSRFTKNPDAILSGFKDYPRGERDGVVHTAKQSVDAVMDTLTQVYPDPQERAGRLHDIFTQFDELKQKAKADSPGKDAQAYEAFARKRIIATMPQAERNLFNQIVEEKFNTKDGKNIMDREVVGVSFSISLDSVLADFIDVLGKLGAVEKKK